MYSVSFLHLFLQYGLGRFMTTWLHSIWCILSVDFLLLKLYMLKSKAIYWITIDSWFYQSLEGIQGLINGSYSICVMWYIVAKKLFVTDSSSTLWRIRIGGVLIQLLSGKRSFTGTAVVPRAMRWFINPNFNIFQWYSMTAAVKYTDKDKISIHEDHPTFPDLLQPLLTSKYILYLFILS